MKDILGIRPFHKGWARMWGELYKRYPPGLNRGGEWLYICSTESEHQFRNNDLVHGTLRHGRKYEFIPIEPGDFEEVER